MGYNPNKPPKKIPLSFEQIEFVRNLLQQENCQIVTQKLWKIIQNKFNFSSQKCFSRRKIHSGLKYCDFKIGYSYAEYDPKVHSGKTLLQITCIHCGILRTYQARQLYGRTKSTVECCHKCYDKHYKFDDEWRLKNSLAQTKSQNRPEVKEKHSKNFKAMWKRKRPQMIASFRKRMAIQENRDKVANGMRKRWQCDTGYRNRVNGKGSLKHSGIYNFDIVYDSKLELMFLLWCADNNIEVKRANIILQYYDEFGVIKDDILPKIYRKQALAYHEAQKQNSTILQRKSA